MYLVVFIFVFCRGAGAAGGSHFLKIKSCTVLGDTVCAFSAAKKWRHKFQEVSNGLSRANLFLAKHLQWLGSVATFQHLLKRNLM
jgi:hypothetical protein